MHDPSFHQTASQDRWYAVCVTPGGEFKARDEIHMELGFEVYCPSYRQQIIRRGKKATRTFALTPGYIFTRCSMNHVFMHAIIGRKHCEDIIRACGTWEPQYIPDWAIETLREIEAGEDLAVERLERAKAEVLVGQWVVLMEGVLKGQRLQVLKLDGKKRIKVSGTEHGTGRPLTVLRSAVEKAVG